MTSFYPVILEAALRALLAGLAVWTGLRLLRVANVLVLKAAWALVLLAALALPLAPSWMGLSAWAAFKLPAFSAKSQVSAAPAPNPEVETAAAPALSPAIADSGRYSSPEISDSHFESAISRASENTAVEAPPTNDESAVQPQSFAPVNATVSNVRVRSQKAGLLPNRIASYCTILYLGVAAALLLRLLLGLISAIRLWCTAKPVTSVVDAAIMEPIMVRTSAQVASPVNIGSGIVLPAEYSQWDDEKLRIVLAHERSHIRQGDFYLQLLSGLYACVFWFSPLGWWLKRRLYELGEAISDRAGLEEAASRTSYAQLLLEFAALPRPTLTGVAMARTSHLSQRIERLLNESSFRQAFAASGRRALLAIILVPLALIGATTLVGVKAATPSTQNQPDAITGQSKPEQVTDQAPAPASVAAPAPESAPAAASAPAPPTGPSAASDALPAPPAPPADVDADAASKAPQAPDTSVHVEVAPGPDGPRIHVHVRPQFAAMPPIPPIPPEAFNFNFHDFAYAFAGQDGDPYAVIGSDGKVVAPHGRFRLDDDERQADIDKARKQAHGTFLWFQQDGKSYIVEDPNVVSQIEAMNKPMDDLQSQMRELSKQMREMGEQQREKARAMRDAAVQTPDLSKELAELKAAEAALQAKQGATITQKELGDLQRDIGRIQGELGSMQGKLALDQSGFGKAMGEFGEQQGKFGSQMGKLGAEMGRIARENQTKMNDIIKDSLSNGKARQVQ
jgi:beta-lactamase regulating signal transducer with metallopeptidase domain